MTECDFSSQQKISTVLGNIFDEEPFGEEPQITRLDIGSADQIYLYMHEVLLKLIFNEPEKKQRSNPYILDVSYYRQLYNSTKHFLNDFNYFVGMRISYKRMSSSPNPDPNSQLVLPLTLPKRFDPKKQFPDYKQPLVA